MVEIEVKMSEEEARAYLGWRASRKDAGLDEFGFKKVRAGDGSVAALRDANKNHAEKVKLGYDGRPLKNENMSRAVKLYWKRRKALAAATQVDAASLIGGNGHPVGKVGKKRKLNLVKFPNTYRSYTAEEDKMLVDAVARNPAVSKRQVFKFLSGTMKRSPKALGMRYSAIVNG